MRLFRLFLAMVLLCLPVALAQNVVPLPNAKTLKEVQGSKCELERSKVTNPKFNPLDPTAQVPTADKTLTTVTNTFRSLPCPATVLAQLTGAVQKSGLTGYIVKLAWAIFLLGVIWHGVTIATGARVGGLQELGVKLLIGAFILVGSSQLRGLNVTDYKAVPNASSGQKDRARSGTGWDGDLSVVSRSAWLQAYGWSSRTFADPALQRAAEETAALGERISNVGSLFITLKATEKAVDGCKKSVSENPLESANPKGLLVNCGIGAAGGGIAGGADGYSQLVNAGLWAVSLSMPILAAYYLVLIGTGFATLAGALLLPLAGALFVFPGRVATDFLSAWFKTTLSAILLVLFMPLVLAGALEIGFIAPGQTFKASLDESNVIMSEAVKSASASSAEASREVNECNSRNNGGGILCTPDWITEQMQRFQEAVYRATSGALSAINPNTYMSMFTSLFTMIASVIIALTFMRMAQQWITEFVGGIMAGTVGGMGGMSVLGNAVSTAGSSFGSRSDDKGKDKDKDKDKGGATKTGPSSSTPSGPKSGGGSPTPVLKK